MRFIATVFLTWSMSLNALADTEGGEAHTLTRSDGTEINYYVFPGEVETPNNVLLLVLQGSDCNSVFHIRSIFENYRSVWPGADLLLVEKYGIDRALRYKAGGERKDCPGNYLLRDSPQQRVEDLNAVLNQIYQTSKKESLVVLGGSEGAVVANLLAASNENIDATISFNGGGRWFIDDVLHNMTTTGQGSAASEFEGFAEHVLSSGPEDLVVSGHGYNWWHQMLSIDQLGVLQQVATPLLLVQGGRDLSVSPVKVEEMVEKLRVLGKSNIDYRRYEQLDHQFKGESGNSEVARVVADMNQWLRSTLSVTSVDTLPKLKKRASE